MAEGTDPPPTPYEPPEQSALGQIADSLLILLLVVASLFLPLYLGLAGSGKTSRPLTGQDWHALDQNKVMQAQWEKLGYTPESARELIASRFDYEFSIASFMITVGVLILYFLFVLYISDREYRQVIAERFGPPGEEP